MICPRQYRGLLEQGMICPRQYRGLLGQGMICTCQYRGLLEQGAICPRQYCGLLGQAGKTAYNNAKNRDETDCPAVAPKLSAYTSCPILESRSVTMLAPT